MRSNVWNRVSLGDVIENLDAMRVPVKETDRRPGPYPYYGASGVVDHVDSYIFDGENLLVAEDGENLRTRQTPVAFLARGKYWVNNHAHIVRGNHLADTRFLMYALSRADISAYLTGSTMPKLTQANLNRIPVPLPPLPIQKRIAHILGTLDDKIELNRRMNETLEAMARAIFKSWFIDFDPVRAKAAGRQPTGPKPEIAALFPNAFGKADVGAVPIGWHDRIVDDMAGLVLGGDWGKDAPSSTFSAPAFCIRGADIPSLQSGGTGNMPIRYLKSSSLEMRLLRPNDIVVEISGGSPTQSTGRPVLVIAPLLGQLEYPLVYSNFCRLFRPKEGLGQFVYLWLRWLYSGSQFLQYENGTTGIKNLAFTAFCQRHELTVPTADVLLAFNQIVGPLLESIGRRGAESAVLATLRDTLLPKLISGELAS